MVKKVLIDDLDKLLHHADGNGGIIMPMALTDYRSPHTIPYLTASDSVDELATSIKHHHNDNSDDGSDTDAVLVLPSQLITLLPIHTVSHATISSNKEYDIAKIRQQHNAITHAAENKLTVQQFSQNLHNIDNAGKSFLVSALLADDNNSKWQEFGSAITQLNNFFAKHNCMKESVNVFSAFALWQGDNTVNTNINQITVLFAKQMDSLFNYMARQLRSYNDNHANTISVAQLVAGDDALTNVADLKNADAIGNSATIPANLDAAVDNTPQQDLLTFMLNNATDDHAPVKLNQLAIKGQLEQLLQRVMIALTPCPYSLLIKHQLLIASTCEAEES